jgi:cell division protein FtsN
MSLKGNFVFKGQDFPNSVRRIEKITKVVKPSGSEHVVIEVATYLGDPVARVPMGEDPAIVRENISCTPEQYAASFADAVNLQAAAYTHIKTFPQFAGLADN